MPLEIEHLPDCPDRDVTHICACIMRYCEKMGVEAEALRRHNTDLQLHIAAMERRRGKKTDFTGSG